MGTGTKAWIRLHANDNCIVALQLLMQGQSIDLEGNSVSLRANILAGHKLAIMPIELNQPVIKYGWPIGVATQRIEPGDHVHDHNLRCEHKVDFTRLATETPEPPAKILDRTFDGFVRSDGSIGTRSYIAVISTVNCSAERLNR